MSTSTPLSSLRVIALDDVAAGAVAWRRRGQLHVTVVVKTCFAFAPDAAMKLAAPEPLVAAEVHHGQSSFRSVRQTSDLAPLRARADVVFAGHAHAPAGTVAARVPVRLALLSREGIPLLDKRLVVIGDRGPELGPAAEPTPFARMQIAYERAAGSDENPFGTGMFGATTLPNVVHPEPRPPRSVEPAGFAPFSAVWPSRRRLLGATPRAQVEQPVALHPGRARRRLLPGGARRSADRRAPRR